jgi:hypothetical protein
VNQSEAAPKRTCEHSATYCFVKLSILPATASYASSEIEDGFGSNL